MYYVIKRSLAHDLGVRGNTWVILSLQLLDFYKHHHGALLGEDAWLFVI